MTSRRYLLGTDLEARTWPPNAARKRAIATRFEKHAANYLAMLKLAAIRIWLRVNESMA